MLQVYTRRRRRRLSGTAPIAVEELCAILPDDIIEDILARLRANAVHRCRVLSRTWAARLASDEFRDRHFRLANRHGAGGGPRVFLLKNASEEGCTKVLSWSPENPRGTTIIEATYDHINNKEKVCQILGYSSIVAQQCQGLLVLKSYMARRYYVFNPSTRRLAMLPQSPAMIRGDQYTFLGIGYDADARQHTVVCIHFGTKTGRFNGCEVYELNSPTTNVWQSLEPCDEEEDCGWVRENRRGWVRESQDSVFAQGHVHWLVDYTHCAYSEVSSIFSFSLDDESSGFIHMPPVKTGRTRSSLTELRGRLCLFCKELNDDEIWALRYDVWLLRSQETCEWDLHCRIDLDTLPPKVASSMCYGQWRVADAGRRIILVEQQPSIWYRAEPSIILWSYDPATKDTETLLDTRGLRDVVSNRDVELKHVAVYKESIASPGQQLVTRL